VFHAQQHLWTYREDVWVITPMSDTDDAHTSNTRTRIGMMDLAGFEIEARDGSIGKVDEATNETSGSWLIVDTGPWIFGRKVMIPAGAVERIDSDTKRVSLNLTKDQIENSPEFDRDRMNDEYRTQLGDYYTRAGWTRAA
jgi:hypothetical protein